MPSEALAKEGLRLPNAGFGWLTPLRSIVSALAPGITRLSPSQTSARSLRAGF